MDKYEHWTYYQSLEDDFLSVSKYIQISSQNYGTFSSFLGRLLINSCIEIERQLKEISKAICDGCSPRPNNITGWYAPITEAYPDFPLFAIKCIPWPMSLFPWEEWSGTESPFWWKNYNKVKHDRKANIASGNLESVIFSISALLISTMFYNRYFYSININKDNVERILLPLILLPRLFSPQNDFGHLIDGVHCYDFI